MRIRRATATDRAEFLCMWADFLGDTHKKGGFVAPTDQSLQVYSGVFEAAIDDPSLGFALLAEDDGEPVGGLMWALPVGGAPFSTRYANPLWSWGVYVRPSHRRTGLARELIERAMYGAAVLGFTRPH